MAGRILVVEDNPNNLELMSYLLRAFGYEVVTATDGAQGIERARATRPDLILLDLQMPRVDGYEAARLIKADPAIVTAPIVAVTAFAMVGDRERVLDAGIDGYLSKPIDPETFVRAVAGFLPPGLRGAWPSPDNQPEGGPR